jgi:hypothetical protein
VQRALRTLLVGTALACGGGAVALAADATSPLTGTWTLNLAKSKFDPGPPPKSDSRTYVESAQGVTVTVNIVTASGATISEHSSYAYDGKDYPITGNPREDALSLKRVNARTTIITQKLSGNVVGTETRVISADGKAMTISAKGTDAKGVPFERVAVYDKQ